MENYAAALITGASSGIGEAFARRLAADGLDLMLVARSTPRLAALARELKASCGVRVEVLSMDLAQPDAGLRVKEAADDLGLAIDLLINNAGVGLIGPSHKLDAARIQSMIALNVTGLVDLTQAFLPALLARGRGAIVNLASMAAFQPTPYMTAYGATKAFVLSYSEGLWAEYRKRGLRVVAVCPGPVDTGFFEATGRPETRAAVPRRLMLKADRVVRESLEALARNQSVVVPGGFGQSLLADLPRWAPREWVAAGVATVLGRSTRERK